MSDQLPRLFTAIWPDADAAAALAAQLRADPDWPPPGWRAIPPDRWHITVRFHGAADPAALASSMDRELASRPAPRLRMCGALRFPGVCAAKVVTASPADAAALATLVASAGADPARYRAHLTVARAGRRAGRAGPTLGLRAHRGPWWRPGEVYLVSSQLGAGGSRYTVLHRVGLHRVGPGGPGGTGGPGSAGDSGSTGGAGGTPREQAAPTAE